MLRSILVLFALLLTSSAYPDDIPESRVPQVVKDNFYSQYKPGKVEWEIEKGNYEAEFYENGREKSVTYTPDGDLVSIETEIDVSEVPLSIVDAVSREYPGAVIVEAEETIKGDIIEYEIDIKIGRQKRDLEFVISDGGKTIEKTKDREDD